jgi:hypothetical protein
MPGHFVPVEMRQLEQEELVMARGKKHTAEQIVNLLRQVEVVLRTGRRYRKPARS